VQFRERGLGIAEDVGQRMIELVAEDFAEALGGWFRRRRRWRRALENTEFRGGAAPPRSGRPIATLGARDKIDQASGDEGADFYLPIRSADYDDRHRRGQIGN
jgi:hypothetical protein